MYIQRCGVQLERGRRLVGCAHERPSGAGGGKEERAWFGAGRSVRRTLVSPVKLSLRGSQPWSLLSLSLSLSPSCAFSQHYRPDPLPRWHRSRWPLLRLRSSARRRTRCSRRPSWFLSSSKTSPRVPTCGPGWSNSPGQLDSHGRLVSARTPIAGKLASLRLQSDGG